MDHQSWLWKKKLSDKWSWSWKKKSSNKSENAVTSQGDNKSQMDRWSWPWKKKSSDKSKKVTTSQGDNKMDGWSWPWKKKSSDKFENATASQGDNKTDRWSWLGKKKLFDKWSWPQKKKSSDKSEKVAASQDDNKSEMDGWSWPWKKKSSDKFEKAAASAADTNLVSTSSQGDSKDNYKKKNYVQISVESYTCLTSLEDQVRTYEGQVQKLEDRIKELNENLSAARSEMTTKDNRIKEAVSGSEKAQAEALALKNDLESVTLSKLTVEDRASHLDGALKECMAQIRNLKEEHELKLQDVLTTKEKQLDKIRMELEAKITNLDQELLRSAAEKAATIRSLQDQSHMLLKANEEKLIDEAKLALLKRMIERMKVHL